MPNNRLNKFLPLLIINIFITFLSFAALFTAIWFTRTSYSSLVNFITHTLNRPDLRPLIIKSLFTYEKYQIVYKIHWILYPFIIIVSLVLYRHSRFIYRIFVFGFRYIQLSFFHAVLFFTTLRRKEKLLLTLGCCFYIVLVLSNNHFKEISYDEAWGYNYYVNKPFYFPFILFNTYPLYNIIAHIFTFLPFDTLTNIRLPSLLFGILSLLALFYTLYNYFSFRITGLGLILLTASPLFYIYSSLSRGITLSLFLSIIVSHVVFRLIRPASSNNRCGFLYIIFNILGIVSMPTFIIYTIAAFLFVMYYKRKYPSFVKAFIRNNFLIFSVSFIFYLPVLLTLAPALIYHNNHYVFNIADSVSKLISFLSGLSQLFFISKYAVTLLLILSFVLLFLKQFSESQRAAIFFSFFVIGFSLLARAASGNIFPERSFNFLILCFIILTLWLTTTLVHQLSFPLKLALTLSFFVLFSFSFMHDQRELFKPAEDKDAKIIGELLIKNKVKTTYIDEEEFWFRVPMIEYYYSEEHKQINFATSSISSTRYQPFDINNNYDCIVCKPSLCADMNSTYKEIYRNRNFVLWKKL